MREIKQEWVYHLLRQNFGFILGGKEFMSRWYFKGTAMLDGSVFVDPTVVLGNFNSRDGNEEM